MSAKTERFSIRKLSIGAASVLIGLTFMGMSGHTVQADTTNGQGQDSKEGQETKADETSAAVHEAKEITVKDGIKATDNNDVTASVKAQDTTDESKKGSQDESASTVQKAEPKKDDTQEAQQDNHQSATTEKATVTADATETTTFEVKKDNTPISKEALGESKVTATTPTADVNAWNYEGDADNLKITGYKNPDQVSGADIVIPNSADLRAAGKLNEGVEAQITYDAVHSLVTGGAKSITINAGNSKEDRLLAVDGKNRPNSNNTNDWMTSFTSETNADGTENNTLKEVKLGGLDVSAVTSMTEMFRNDKALEKVTGLDTWDLASLASRKEDESGVGQMFNNDSNLKEIQGIGDWKHTENIAYADFMFNNASSLTNLDLSKWTPTNLIWANSMFENASNLESVGDLSHWNLNNVERSFNMFNNDKKLTTLGNIGGWFGQGSKNTNTNHMFSNTWALTSVGDLSNWNLANVTDASYMFNDAKKLNGIGNIGGWFPRGSKIINMTQMFNDAGSLTSVGDISGWDTSNVTNMGQLFREATSLSTIGNLNNWNVSNVTYMAGMFQGVPASSIGDLSNWDTNKVTNMDYMFAQTPNLTNIGNLNATDHTNGRVGWNNSGALEVAFRMFMNSGIQNLDLSGWKFSDSLSSMNQNTYLGPTTMANRNNGIFANMTNPATITMNGWQDSVTSNLHAADFDGNQPLIVISDSSNLQNLNTDEIKTEQLGIDRNSSNANVGAKGHVANTITFVSTSDENIPIASQQQNFVFASQDALDSALDNIKTDGNINTVQYGNETLSGKYVAGSGAYLNGKHNATGTEYADNYGKIAGTYSVQTEQDVTQDLIRQNDPHLQKATATYRVVEKFPDYYNGTGTLTADQYAAAIGDSANATNYAGYVYKIVLSQPITAYRKATKNLLTGEINYNGPYSLANSDLSGATGFPAGNTTYTGTMELDHPDHYNISAAPTSYRSDEKDERGNSVLSYTFTAPTATAGPSFVYDLINGYQAPNENYITFNSLPASQTFYVNYTAQTENVTQQEKIDPITRTNLVVERFPSYYKTQNPNDSNILTAAQYRDQYHVANASDDYVYKVIMDNTITMYKRATKNLVTGQITHSDNYYESDNQYNNPIGNFTDSSFVRAGSVDTPAGYTISASNWDSTQKSNEGNVMLRFTYNATDKTFMYDFIVGDSTNGVSFTANDVPDNHQFYIDYTAQTEDVTQELIDGVDGQHYPADHMKTATYQVIEKFPSDYAGAFDTNGNLKAGYTINDNHIERVVANQTVTAYQTATKNLATGEITYSNDYNSKYVTFDTTTPNSVVNPGDPLWSHEWSTGDVTYITSAPVDTPAGYTISADPVSYVSPEKDAEGGTMLKISYSATNHTFNYDFMVGTSDGNANQQKMFTILPGSYNFYINYTAEDQHVKIQFVDTQNNNQPVPNSEITKNGTTDQTIQLDLTNNNIPAGYKLAEGQTLPTDYKFTAGNDQTITIKLVHKVDTITGNNIPAGGQTPSGQPLTDNDFKQTITRTITAELPSGNQNLSQTTDITRTAQYDEVTKKVISWGDWSKSNFAAVNVPQVPGYTAQINGQDAPSQISAEPNVTDGYNDPNIKITYKANPQSITINYKDADGNIIGTATVIGTTGETKDNDVSSHVPAGWKLVPGQNIPAQTDFTYNQDGQPNFRDIDVKIEHATTVVQPDDPKTPSDTLPDNPGEKYPEGVGRDDLNKTITRTIKITKPDGSVEDKTQTLTFKRTATVDEVTKEITYGDWEPADGSTNSFGEVDVPEIPGYTRSQADVPAKTLTNDEITNWKDTPINISYTPNEQTGKIEYVDGNGNVIGTTDLTGTTGSSVPINPVAPAGWTIVPGQNIPTSVTVTADGIPTVTVKVVPVSSGDDGGSTDNGDNPAPDNNPDTKPDQKPDTKPNDDKKPEKPAKPNKTKPNKSKNSKSKNSKTTKSKNKANKAHKANSSKVARHNTGNHASNARYRGLHGQAGTLLKNKSVYGNHGSGAPSHLNGQGPAANTNGTNANNKAAQLPQTGENEGQAGLLGVILASMGLTTAIGAKKRKKN